MTLNSDNIEAVINDIKSKIGVVNPSAPFLIIPKTARGAIDRSKYKGKGRPRNSDYERVDFLSLLEGEYVLAQ